MSVPKYKRGESNVAFVTKAVALEAAVGAMCARLPKRWLDTRTRYMTDCANDVLKNAVRANAIWPRTIDELEKREAHLQEAIGACQELQIRIDSLLATRPMKAVKGEPGQHGRLVPCVSDGLLFSIAESAQEEAKLLKGVIRSDRKRWGGRRAPVKSTRAGGGNGTTLAFKRASQRARGR